MLVPSLSRTAHTLHHRASMWDPFGISRVDDRKNQCCKLVFALSPVKTEVLCVWCVCVCFTLATSSFRTAHLLFKCPCNAMFAMELSWWGSQTQINIINRQPWLILTGWICWSSMQFFQRFPKFFHLSTHSICSGYIWRLHGQTE